MRFAAAFLLAAAAAAVGQYYSIAASRRIKIIESIAVMLRAIKSEIEFCMRPTDKILEALCKRAELKNLKFLNECKVKCGEGMAFPVAWREVLEERQNTAHFKRSDIEHLAAFGEIIGTTDVSGQMNHCKLYEAIFEESLSSARKYKESTGRLYSKLGILAGILIAIIVI